MSAKKSKTFFKTLTAILVLLLFFGGYYIYSSGIFGASVTENISEHSITDEERLIEYEEYGITYDESSQSYLYQDSLIKNLRDGDFLYTNAAGSIKLIIQRDDNGHIQSMGAPGLPVRSVLRARSDLMGFLTGRTSTVPCWQPVVSVCAISLPTRPRRLLTVA